MTANTDGGPGASLWAGITRQRWGAIAGAAICLLATCKLMFSDVNFWQPSSISNDQAASFAALAVAILAGHYCWPELKALRITGLGLLVLTVASSWYVVTTSAGRTSESRADAALKIQASNDIRSTAKGRVDNASSGIATANAELKAALEAYKTAQTKLSAECGSGKGRLCQGHIEAEAVARQAVREAREAVKSANAFYEEVQTKFSALAAPRVENAGYKHTAAWLASLPFVTTPAAVIADLLATQIPGLLALICEFGVVTFSNVAFRKRTDWQPRIQYPRLPSPTVTVPSTVIANPVSAFSPLSGAELPERERKAYQQAKRKRPTDVQLVLSALERARGPVSNEELAHLLGCSTGESSKRLQNCGDAVVIGRNGRCYAIAPNYRMV